MFRSNMLGFGLANVVLVWVGCVHTWCCECFPYVLALGWVQCLLDGWVDSYVGVWLCQDCGLRTCLGFPLANVVVVF